MEVSKSIFKRQADFLEKNGKYLLQFTNNCYIGKKILNCHLLYVTMSFECIKGGDVLCKYVKFLERKQDMEIQ